MSDNDKELIRQARQMNVHDYPKINELIEKAESEECKKELRHIWTMNFKRSERQWS